MLRSARLDAPGALQHIIILGIEGRKIFRDDTDRDDFLGRLATLLPATETACFAWALMPNHAHLLLRTGAVPITTLMRRLLTGYAVSFNRRHSRSGQLFQNRYKSILARAGEQLHRSYQLKLSGYELESVAARAASLCGIEVEKIFSRGKQRSIVQARSLLCYWASRELGLPTRNLRGNWGSASPRSLTPWNGVKRSQGRRAGVLLADS